jgi:hypothetical protein
LFRAIVGQSTYLLPAGDGHHAYQWQNTNPLIGTYAGAIGIKTGDTKAAGNCLLFEAARYGLTLIGVTLGTPGDDIPRHGPGRHQGLELGALPTSSGSARPGIHRPSARPFSAVFSARKRAVAKLRGDGGRHLPGVEQPLGVAGADDIAEYAGQQVPGNPDAIAGRRAHRPGRRPGISKPGTSKAQHPRITRQMMTLYP